MKLTCENPVPANAENSFEYPKKTREMETVFFDSTIWNDFTYRDDDIVIASYGKSGTTWIQQAVAQLLFNAEPELNVAELSPWLDHRLPPKDEKLPMVERQQHRRFLKTHLPVDALVFSPDVKYIYVARDGRDVAWSLHNHYVNRHSDWDRELVSKTGQNSPETAESVEAFFRDWLNKDGYPFWPYWENIASWWQIRHLPNVHFVHFSNLKLNLSREIENIAVFLEIDRPKPEIWKKILKHCSFDYMKKNAEKYAPMGGKIWKGGAKTFIYKGTNQRWKNILSAQDISRYESIAEAELGPECAHWLATGALS